MDVKKWLQLQWDRAAAWLFAAGGAVVLLLGWLGVSRYAYPADQLPYIVSGGIGGLFLLGIGATLWLSADVRDEWRKLDLIESALRQLAESANDHAAAIVHAGSNLPAGANLAVPSETIDQQAVLATSAVGRDGPEAEAPEGAGE